MNLQNKWEEILGTQSIQKTNWMNSYVNNHMNYSPMTQSNYFPDALPIAMRIAARTISMDLVSVQPMSAPSGFLSYIDFNYSKESRTNKIRKILDKVNKRLES
jgi:hypothetical protein